MAGENSVLKDKNSFKAAVGWASSDKIGTNDDFQKDVTTALSGELCKPFDARKAQSMANVINNINSKGHNVKFFIQASDKATADHDKSGSSETKPDYEIQSGCNGKNQHVFIGPGRG